MNKTIVLYANNFDPLKSLTLEQKGRLFDALFLYSLEEPLPDMDPLTEMAWSFLKINIDHAREAYEEMRQRRSNAGKKGMASRWHNNDNNVINDIADYNKDNNDMQPITSYNNDNLKEKKIKENKRKEEKGKENKGNLPDYVARTEDVTELADRYIASQAFKAFAVANNITRPRAEQLLKRFVLHLQSTDDTAKTWRDFCSHFASWARYELPRLNEETARPAIPSAFLNPEPL